MKEAYGGIFNILFVSIFLVIAIGVLGLVVAYTKAFNMKSAIIAIIEEHEGSGCYGTSTTSSSCFNKIKQKAQDLAYNPVSLSCPSEYTKVDNIYCYKMQVQTKAKDNKRYAVFTVITQVDIPFPIIDKITGMRFFQVGGDTKEIQLQT